MPKFKKGDNVRAIGLSIYGADLRGKELIVDDPEYHSCDGVVVKVTGDYLMRPTDLEHVKKSQAARILTEKVTIDGVPCMTWLKRAGSRLAKIRKQEKAAWSGKETVEI